MPKKNWPLSGNKHRSLYIYTKHMRLKALSHETRLDCSTLNISRRGAADEEAQKLNVGRCGASRPSQSPAPAARGDQPHFRDARA